MPDIKDKNCIQAEDLRKLYDAIKIYANFTEKDYIIGFSPSKNQPLSYMKIRIKEANFWHLLGCELNCTEVIAKHKVFNNCLLGEDVSKDISYTRARSDVSQKYNVFINNFDFITHAPRTRIVSADGQYQVYDVGIGCTTGIIGYGVSRNSDWYFPKTSVNQSALETDRNPGKIFFVLSKPIDNRNFQKIEYEIKDGYIKDNIDQILNEININCMYLPLSLISQELSYD